MAKRSEEQLVPKNGHILMGLIVCRISGCTRQKEASNEDQHDNSKEAVAELYDGQVHFDVISTKGKGEHLDRPELEKIEAAYRSGKYDLVVFDDLSRLIRGGEATRLLGIGVDHGTRTVCVQDGIDTADPTWEEDALNACSENVAHQERTSRRIKQKTMNRFKKFGATANRSIYGYIVPRGAKSYDDWRKDPSAEKHILDGAQILRATLNGESVADFFRENQVPTGPGARSENWDGTMVLRFYRNTLLKGMARRGAMATVKHHGSGKRQSKKNPKGPTYYDAPHLAYFSHQVFDELVRALADKNQLYRRKGIDGIDSRMNVPRKRTRLPGQCAVCWYCGRKYVWGGNGVNGQLMCSGAPKWNCWNSSALDGVVAARVLAGQLSSSLLQLQGLDTQFCELVQQAQRAGKDGLPAQWDDWRRRKALHEMATRNVQDAVLQFGRRSLLAEQLDQLESDDLKLKREKFKLESIAEERLDLPESIGFLCESMQCELTRLAIESYEFADLMRSVISSIHVYLVQLIDGGSLYSRAKVVFDLAGRFPNLNLVPELHNMVKDEVTLDLWDDTPQRELIRAQAVQLAAAGNLTYSQIGERTTPRVTGTPVGRSLALHKQMLALGLTSPWVTVSEPPAKLLRAKNPKFQFKPVDGYERPSL